MTLPSSGALSFSQIQGEFGGSNPISLSEYYRGGPIVPNHGNTSPIPTSGQISVSQFYGTSVTAPFPTSRSATISCVVGGNDQGYGTSYSSYPSMGGSISPNPIGTLSSGANYNIRSVRSSTVGCKIYLYFEVLGNQPNANWSTITVGTAAGGNVSSSRSSMTYNGNQSSPAGTYTQWFNQSWIFPLPTSGTSAFSISV